jgi:hypothetical protein
VLHLVGHVHQVVDEPAGHELVAQLAQQRDLAPVRQRRQRPVGHLHEHQRERPAGVGGLALLGREPVAQVPGAPQAGLGIDRRQLGPGRHRDRRGRGPGCELAWAWAWTRTRQTRRTG